MKGKTIPPIIYIYIYIYIYDNLYLLAEWLVFTGSYVLKEILTFTAQVNKTVQLLQKDHTIGAYFGGSVIGQAGRKDWKVKPKPVLGT